MRNTIEVLGQSSFKSVLSRPSEGLMALTLLCLIDWPDGQKRQCFVKIFSQAQSIGVFNEILGYLLTKAEGLPVAPKSGLLILPEALKTQINIPVASVAFVTSKIEGRSPSSFHSVGDAIRFNALCNVLNSWDMLHHTIAFDEWVANQDRNLGNLIIGSNNSVTLIDHSNLPVDLLWTPDMLDSLIEPRNVLGEAFRNVATLPQKMDILKGTSNQKSSLGLVKDEVLFWAEKMLTEPQKDKLISFLDTRAEQSKLRLSKKFGVLAGVA